MASRCCAAALNRVRVEHIVRKLVIRVSHGDGAETIADTQLEPIPDGEETEYEVRQAILGAGLAAYSEISTCDGGGNHDWATISMRWIDEP